MENPVTFIEVTESSELLRWTFRGKKKDVSFSVNSLKYDPESVTQHRFRVISVAQRSYLDLS